MGFCKFALCEMYVLQSICGKYETFQFFGSSNIF